MTHSFILSFFHSFFLWIISPWAPEDEETLRELYEEFKTYPMAILIDFIKGDVRLETKTKASIKDKLHELQLIQAPAAKRDRNDPHRKKKVMCVWVGGGGWGRRAREKFFKRFMF